MSLQKIILSNSTNGRGIAVANTTIDNGTVIHVSANTTTAGLGDEIVLYATHITANVHTLTLGIGGTSTSDLQYFYLNPNTTAQVVPGLLVTGGLSVYAAADAINVTNIHGYVIRSS